MRTTLDHPRTRSEVVRIPIVEGKVYFHSGAHNFVDRDVPLFVRGCIVQSRLHAIAGRCPGLEDRFLGGVFHDFRLGRVLGEGGVPSSNSGAASKPAVSAQAGRRAEADAGAAGLFRRRLRAAHRLSVEGPAPRVRQRQYGDVKGRDLQLAWL